MGRKTNRKLVKGYKQPVHNSGNPKGEYMETCSDSSIIRAMQTKTTRYHFTPVRLIENFRKSGNFICWQRYEEMQILVHF